AAVQLRAPHLAGQRPRARVLPLAYRDPAQAHARRRLRDRLRLLHQSHAARGRRPVPARHGRLSTARTMATTLSIAHLASEMAPIVKVGGLGDVVAALAAEQARRGHAVTVALPAYAAAQIGSGWARQTLGTEDVPWGMGREPAHFRL